LKIEIISEHADWLVAYKPENLDFHDSQGEPGFFSLLSDQVGYKLYPVHRLDKPTSGLMLVAKNESACRQLNELFRDGNIDKFYLAVVSNKLKKKQGKVKGDMAKARNGSFKLLKTLENPALTQFISVSLMPKYRLCLLKPKTGRTHQLRVALKSLAAPIVGDKRYGGEVSDRLYLHAYGLAFEWQGKQHCFSVLPTDGVLFKSTEMIQCLESWQTPWQLNWPQ